MSKQFSLTLIFSIMDYIITSHVIKTVKGLKEPERSAIANAIVAEFVLGENPKSSLTPVQAMLFAMIRDYIRRDSARRRDALSPTPCRAEMIDAIRLAR